MTTPAEKAALDSVERVLAANRIVPMWGADPKMLATAVVAGLLIDGVKLEVRSK